MWEDKLFDHLFRLPFGNFQRQYATLKLKDLENFDISETCEMDELNHF